VYEHSIVVKIFKAVEKEIRSSLADERMQVSKDATRERTLLEWCFGNEK
jgi:hypothetical protein